MTAKALIYLYFTGFIIWLAVATILLPAGHSFVDRLLTFGWTAVGVGGLLLFIKAASKRPPQ